jgi:hypothetical protein
VEPTASSLLSSWGNFYVIAGSAAAALTGLQFVVIVLGAEGGIGSEGTNRAFGTPTIVHFCAVLLVSAILSAPWPSLRSTAWVVGACATAGLVYTLAVWRHVRRQTAYAPVLEDWVWHVAVPLITYAVLLGAALELRFDPRVALFFVGASSLLLLFVGIHNAWDAVTYIALRRRSEITGQRGEGGKEQGTSSESPQQGDRSSLEKSGAS